MAIFTFDDEDAVGAKKDAQQGAQPTVVVDDVFAADKMDMDFPPLQVGTPPIAIASPLPKRAVQPNLEAKQQGPEKLDFNAVMKKAQKNKKKKKKALDGIAPAASIARGFHTPVTSGGEESDFSAAATPRLGPAVSGLPSVTSSPALRPISSMGGISSLKAQLEALNLGTRADSPLRHPPAKQVASGMSSNTSMSGLDSTSDSDRTEMESYEVNLDEDFSADAPSKTSTMLGNNIMRKMSADDFEPIKCLGKGSYGTVLLHRFFRKIDWKKLEARECEPPIQPLITDPELAENFNQEFTDLPLSPVLTRNFLSEAQSNPFGGFSFVASQSLLDSGEFGC
ncbi:serine/threonine protein kinase psk1 [Didymella keratinophila]|nr:serine/threonine protein kinase psk1 [Didymella keratinophila]